jgi:hypothetical protein
MAVAANQRVAVQSPGKIVSYPVLTNIVHYKGVMAFVTAAGFLTDVISTTANTFAGITKDAVDATGVSSGVLECECWTEGDFELIGSGFVAADLHSLVYAVDNYVVSLTATDQPLVGRIVRVNSATNVTVRIDVSGN